MNRLIVPACLLYVASLVGTAAGAEAVPPANSPTTDSIVTTPPVYRPFQPLRAKCRTVARTTLGVVAVPVVLGTYWCIHGVQRCGDKVRSAFTPDRAQSCE
ncbi:MAG: hypothetical protein JNM56_30245 [Planctomycetia bacterium]|nr:hypothetical protein [Planctomycetia bacterium]